MREIFVFLVIIILSAAIGKRIFRLIGVLQHNKLEELIFSLSLGIAFFSYLTLLLGALKLLYAEIFIIILLILFIIFIKEILYLSRILLEKVDKIKTTNYSIIQYIIFVLLSAFILVIFILCFSPALIWDELYYHLVIPKFFINAKGIVYIPYIPHSNFPQFPHMLYTMGMLLSSDLICNLIQFLFGILCILATYSFSRKYGNSDNLLCALIFISLPVVNMIIASPYVESSTCLYSFLAIYCLMNCIKNNDKRFLFLAAIFGGISATTKYSGVVVISLICLILLLRKDVKMLFLYLLIAIIIASPFYIKNQIIAGNPFYPFLYNIFGGRDLTNELAKEIIASITSFGGMGKGVEQFFLLPYNLTFHKDKFYGDITLLYLVFLPLIILFLPKYNVYLKYLLLFAFFYLIYWFLSTQQARFLLLVILILTVMITFIINEMTKFNKYIGYIIYFLLLLFIFNNFYNLINSNNKRLLTSLGLIKKENYIVANFPPYEVFKYINKNLSPKARIYFANDNRVYYCDREFIVPDFIMLKKFKTEIRYEMLNQLGVTHLFINLNLCPFDIELCKIINHDWLSNRLKLVYKKYNVMLFAIDYKK